MFLTWRGLLPRRVSAPAETAQPPTPSA